VLRALGARLLGFGAREMHEVLRLLFMSARDYFDEVSGLSGPVKALLCGAAVRGCVFWAGRAVAGAAGAGAARPGAPAALLRGG
jgi:hypothetical protein